MLAKKTKINLKKISKIFLILAGFLVFLNLTSFVFADSPVLPPKPGTLPGPSSLVGSDGDQRSTILDFILPNFTVLLIGFIGAAALLFLIIGGLRMVVSFGDDDSVGNGKQQVKWGIIGLLISLLSYTIVRLIVNLEFENDTNNQNIPEQNQTENSESTN